MKPGLLLFTALGILGVAPWGAVEVRADQADLEHRLRTEGVAGWAKLRDAAQCVEGTGTFTEVILATSKKPEKVSRIAVKIKVNREMVCYEKYPLDEHGEQSAGKAVGANSHYIFFINRQQADTPWVLNSISDAQPVDPAKHPRFQAHHLGPWGYLELAWTVGGPTFPEVLDDSRFTIKQLAEVDCNGNPCVRLDFAYRPVENPGKEMKTPMIGGSVVFDPNRHWAIQRYEWQLPEKVVIKGDLTYEEMSGPKYLVKRSQQSLFVGDQEHSRSTFEFDQLALRTIPERELSLSAFGLPEPPGVRFSQPIRWYVWAAVGAVVCLALAVLFRWFARRGAEPSRSSPGLTV